MYMKRIICFFFGHVENKIEQDLSHFKTTVSLCKRCNNLIIEMTPK